MNEQIEKLREKVEKDPSSKLFVPLAEEYRKNGMFDEAVSVLESGLARQPDYMSGRVALGKIFLEKGMKAEAQAEFERVIGVIPDNLYAQRKLADMYLEKGDLEAARTAFRMVLNLHPRDEEARKILDDLESRDLPAEGVGAVDEGPEGDLSAVSANFPGTDEDIPELPPVPPESAESLPTAEPEELGVDFGGGAWGGSDTGGGDEVFEGLGFADEGSSEVSPPEDLTADESPTPEPDEASSELDEVSAEPNQVSAEPDAVLPETDEVSDVFSDDAAAPEYEIPENEEYDLKDLGIEIPDQLTPASDEGSAELEEFRRSVQEGPIVVDDDADDQDSEDLDIGTVPGQTEDEGPAVAFESVGTEGGDPEPPSEVGVEPIGGHPDEALAEADSLVQESRYHEAVAVLKQAFEAAPEDRRLAQRAEELSMLISLVGAEPSGEETPGTTAPVLQALEGLLEGFRRRKTDGV